jgi:hypothetical protein
MVRTMAHGISHFTAHPASVTVLREPGWTYKRIAKLSAAIFNIFIKVPPLIECNLAHSKKPTYLLARSRRPTLNPIEKEIEFRSYCTLRV